MDSLRKSNQRSNDTVRISVRPDQISIPSPPLPPPPSLNSLPSSPSPPASSAARANMFDQIRSGTSLKKVQVC